MTWLKSLWLKVQLPKGRIAQSQVLIPMPDKVQEEQVVVVKAKRPRKKKVKTDEPTVNQ